jgi:zinc protease
MRPFPALFLFASLTTMPLSADTPILPFKATEKLLPNGLKVIVVPTGFPNLVSIQIPVQTGSRNEVEPGKSGFAHFFEHMMFRGTKEYPPDRYQSVLTRAGARSNAYTDDDYTNYHATFAKEDLEIILKMEADRFQNLSYTEEAFKTESRAVLGEYNKNSADPVNKILEVQRDHAYTKHTYKHTTMGFLKDIEDMPNQFEYAKTFFDRWYRPEHTTVIVAGDVVADQVLPLVEKYWGSWKRGTHTVDVPLEPPPVASVYAHVPWAGDTLPWVTVAFHAPAFSETQKDYAAVDALLDLTFGPTSDLYKRLVEQEQKVDQMFVYYPGRVDSPLATVLARVKTLDAAVPVRDAILRAFATARTTPVVAQRLADAQSNARYAFARSLDNTEAIASNLARFVCYRRSFDTVNNLFRVTASLSSADLLAAAQKHFTDPRLVTTTLSKEMMPVAMTSLPLLASLAPSSTGAEDLKLVTLKSVLPQLDVTLLFTAGSAHDPKGKEGLAALSAAMIAQAGSRDLRVDEIKKALFPMAGSFDARVDKEMTTFTGVIHKDNAQAFLDVALPMLTEPGFREEDFARLKDAQLTALKGDLRADNEEELGKERLQQNVFAGTPYGHPVLGTVAGLGAITLGDVKAFVKAAYNRGNLTVGVSGDVPDEVVARLKAELAHLPAGPVLPAPEGIAARRPEGREVEIIAKETRATAVSFGFPVEVTRSHPDFVALSVARAWLGEHRASMGRLYKRIREVRGMNYGDYAYIEAFPRGMFQFFPDPNVARRAQLFEVWLRPLRTPEDAHMALRIAIHELDALIENGLSQEAFEATRNYLMKNVFVMTSTQSQQLGYALDAQWYGTPEFTSFMRERLQKLTLADVDAAIRKHLQTKDLSIVMVTKAAGDLKERLGTDAPSAVKYDAPKAELAEEDKVIGVMKLGIKPEAIRITPAEDVFAR